MLDLTGKVAVITGAAQGIGAATASQLANLGATVVIADIREAAATATAADIGPTVQGRHIDVASSESVREVVKGVVAELGHIDIWINNAGIVEDSPSVVMPDEIWQRTIDLDLTGTFYGCREAGAHMIERGSGVILNVSSIAAFRATRPEHHVAYDVAKRGVSYMARVLAAEWAQHGVRVNAIAPGYTNTDILKGVGSESPETMATWLAQVPQQRLMEPVEIAQVIAFLVSDAASSITGQTIHADGGHTAW